VLAAGSFTSRHATHLAAVAIPVAMIVFGVVADSVHTRRKRRANGDVRPAVRLRGRTSVALRVAAAASIGAAVVHLRVLPDHAAESAWSGAFFAGAALVQISGAALLVRDVSRRFVLLFATGNGAVIGLWLFTRLVSIPLGPSAGSAESFGGLDILASTLEAVVVAACAGALWPRRVASTVRARRWDAVTIPVITVATVALCATVRVG
jgi:hypothetical protein